MEKILKNRLRLVTTLWVLLTMAMALMPRWSLRSEFELGLNHGPIAHFIAYSVLAILVSQLLLGRLTDRLKIALFAWLITGTFATLVEFGQKIFPYRTFDIEDIWLNLFAAFVGAFSWWLYQRKFRRI